MGDRDSERGRPELTGFAGLGGMVSDVESDKKLPPRDAEGPEAPQRATSNSSEAAGPSSSDSSPAQPLSQGASSGAKGALVGLGILLAVLLVTALVIARDNSRSATQPYSQDLPFRATPPMPAGPDRSSPSASLPPSGGLAAAPTAKAVPSVLTEALVPVPLPPRLLLDASRPGVGADRRLGMSEIRWCMYEHLRIDSSRSAVNSEAELGRFNGFVSDYNSRCGSFQYRKGELERAKADAESAREVLTKQGIGRLAAAPSGSGRASPTRIRQLVEDSGKRYSLPVPLLLSLIEVTTAEKGKDPQEHRRGLMGVSPSSSSVANDTLDDPEENIEAGTRLLRSLINDSDGILVPAIAAYRDGVDARKSASAPARAFAEAVVEKYRARIRKPDPKPPPKPAPKVSAAIPMVRDAVAESAAPVAIGEPGCPSGMARMPSGRFSPARGTPPVDVRTFCIDSTEVTVARYAACVGGAGCKAPPACDPGANFGKPDRAQHPINCVDAVDAEAFCAWSGKRLPTDDEWEWAARSGAQGSPFPWGRAPPGAGVCWLRWKTATSPALGTCEVGTSVADENRQHVMDLAANVGEWTASPAITGGRLVRGGGWADDLPEGLSTSYREAFPPGARYGVLGFRCAK